MKISLIATLLMLSFSTIANPVKGYADLHVHMFSNEAFGGGWYLGEPEAKTRAQLFNYCKEGEKWPWIKGFLEAIDPYISSFVTRNNCIIKEESFPQWNDLSHQQVWFKDLKKAKENGLSLMIMSSVHSFVLCKALPSSRKKYDSCEDLDSHILQLTKAKKLIDSQDWLELALTAADARRIINSGKLAIVFSVESSNVFDSKNWKVEFQKYWDLGVRTLQIVHQFDNKMAGAALHKGPLHFAHYLRNWLRYERFEGFEYEEISYETNFGQRLIKKNKKGLTELGKELIQHMMKMKMPIDFAHMSEKTMNNVLKIMPANYPFYFSHGHFRDMQKGGLGNFEKSSSKKILKNLVHADGIFGLRTITYPTYQYDKKIQNNCDGSSLSFAQAFRFGQDLGLNIAFGSDFNGFIPQTRPRFSDTDPNYCKGQKVKRLNTDFDTSGLGRVDQLDDMLMDLKNLGVNTHELENSSEKFIQVWEKSGI